MRKAMVHSVEHRIPPVARLRRPTPTSPQMDKRPPLMSHLHFPPDLLSFTDFSAIRFDP